LFDLSLVILGLDAVSARLSILPANVSLPLSNVASEYLHGMSY